MTNIFIGICPTTKKEVLQTEGDCKDEPLCLHTNDPEQDKREVKNFRRNPGGNGY